MTNMTNTIILAPNAFKGSLRAVQAAEAMARGLADSGLQRELDLMPVADGGDGTLDVLLAGGGRRVTCTADDPLGRPRDSEFGLLDDGRTAVVEMARASGLALLTRDERDPMRASTHGTGQLMIKAAELGARTIIVGVGGSATVDGGAGCLQAMGVRLLDAEGRDLPPGAAGLARLASIDLQGLHPALRDVRIRVACDVDNPVLGERGSARVFAPQKGATPEQVPQLEANLGHFFTLAAGIGRDVRDMAGAGAAGALAGGLTALAGASLESGSDLVLNQIGADERIARACLVVTAEGRLDSQSLGGKGPVGVQRRAAAHNVPVVALAGEVLGSDALFTQAGFRAVASICDGPTSLEDAMRRTAEAVECGARRLGLLMRLGADVLAGSRN
jgi:glycerate kinase